MTLSVSFEKSGYYFTTGAVTRLSLGWLTISFTSKGFLEILDTATEVWRKEMIEELNNGRNRD